MNEHATEERRSSDAIALDGTKESVARINYNVPLPGSHTGRRVLKLDVDIQDEDWADHVWTAGKPYAEEAGVRETSEGRYVVDEDRAIAFWIERLRISGLYSGGLKDLEDKIRGRSSGEGIASVGAAVSAAGVARAQGLGTGISGLTLGFYGGSQDPEELWRSARRRLDEGIVEVPFRMWSGKTGTACMSITEKAMPSLYLVEVYGISSFLGDYGLGRTVKTFTLLPGESTTISMRTWKATKESIAQSSSIVDSHSSTAAERFEQSMLNETTDKSTHSSKEEWHAEAEASASWGWGKAKVKGGGSGEYQSGREEFAKQANDTVQEHANEASATREMTVTSSSERSEETEAETVIERTIKNVNMRRTLNFVFRELNQEYITKIHLKDCRIAFTNGRSGTWREVPLSGLRGLLQEVLKKPGKVNEVARSILKLAGTVFDRNDLPVRVLEEVEMSANGQEWTVGPAHIVAGEYPYAAPTDDKTYRFKRKALAQEGDAFPVDGVVMKESKIVMRTDSVMVEALLGQADALDSYAMEVQQAAAAARTLENERERIAHDTLRGISSPVDRASAFDAMFNPKEAES